MDQEKITKHVLKDRGWRKLDWSVKGPVYVIALILGFFDHALHWGALPFAAALAMTYPIVAYRDFWGEVRFWITISLLCALQVVVVIVTRPMFESSNIFVILAFGIVDCGLMVAAVSWVCSQFEVKSSR